MAARPQIVSAVLIGGTIAAGLALRLTHAGLPFVIVKYGGSMLWALMIYWIVSTLRRHWPIPASALAAMIVSSAVELFKLYHTPWLDGFRLTLPGALLLGRVFALWDLAAYAAAIALGALADRRVRPAPTA
jgi:hypothetical protein